MISRRCSRALEDPEGHYYHLQHTSHFDIAPSARESPCVTVLTDQTQHTRFESTKQDTNKRLLPTHLGSIRFDVLLGALGAATTDAAMRSPRVLLDVEVSCKPRRLMFLACVKRI